MFRKAMCLFGLMMPVLIIAFLGLLSGCGTGGLEEAPVTSDLSVTVAAEPTSVSTGQTSIITATVTGDKNSGATVEFSLPVNSSGASFINSSGSSVSSITVTASGSGIATAVYQPGITSPTLSVYDTVQAAVGTATSAVVITRSVSTTTTYAVSIGALPTSVTTGQVSIITATVTSGSTPAGGVTVTFTLPVNNSGATLSPATSTTDDAGNAVVIYQPGTTSPTLSVYDTVQAAVGTATSAVTITRSGSVSATTYAVSIGALPTSVTAGQVSVITATVKSGSTPASGVTVIFTLPVNGSGAALSPATATTDGAGNAVVIYQAGATSPTLSVYDAVQASVGTATSAVAITRSGSASATTYAVSVGASTTSVTAGQDSVITATVTSESGPAGGVPVTFTLPVNNSGATLSPATATTDGAGNAVVTYQPGNTNPTQTVSDTVQAAVGTVTDTVVITRVGSAAYSITVSADPNPLVTNSSSSVVTANVKNSLGEVISGVIVNFAVTGVAPFGTLSVALATTDGSGNAETIFTGNGVGPTGATSVVTASITVDGNTYTDDALITYP